MINRSERSTHYPLWWNQVTLHANKCSEFGCFINLLPTNSQERKMALRAKAPIECFVCGYSIKLLFTKMPFLIRAPIIYCVLFRLPDCLAAVD